MPSESPPLGVRTCEKMRYALKLLEEGRGGDSIAERINKQTAARENCERVVQKMTLIWDEKSEHESRINNFNTTGSKGMEARIRGDNIAHEYRTRCERNARTTKTTRAVEKTDLSSEPDRRSVWYPKRLQPRRGPRVIRPTRRGIRRGVKHRQLITTLQRKQIQRRDQGGLNPGRTR